MFYQDFNMDTGILMSKLLKRKNVDDISSMNYSIYNFCKQKLELIGNSNQQLFCTNLFTGCENESVTHLEQILTGYQSIITILKSYGRKYVNGS